MKQMRQMTSLWGAPAQAAIRPVVRPRPLVRSTAAILAQGVTLRQVQQAVRMLRPLIEQAE